MSVDNTKLINRATAVTVALVATFAAIISYTHIYSLARLHHAPVIDAGLTPLVTDGLILASSLVLLYAAKHKLQTPKLAHVTLWLGIAATVAANVAYGLSQGWESALIDSWPAVAFIGSVEAVMHLAKAKRVAAKKAEPEKSIRNAVKTINEMRREQGWEDYPYAEDRASLYPNSARQDLPELPKETLPSVKVPTVRQIRDHLKPCGQPRAQDIRNIIIAQGLTIDQAAKVREEVKRSG